MTVHRFMVPAGAVNVDMSVDMSASTFTSKTGFHLWGANRDVMCHAEFSVEFLCEPYDDDWRVDWDHMDGSTRPCGCEDPRHGYMGGVLVKHLETGRVWKLTGEHRINDAGQEMYRAEWPD